MSMNMREPNFDDGFFDQFSLAFKRHKKYVYYIKYNI